MQNGNRPKLSVISGKRQTNRSAREPLYDANLPIVCFSHLRWDFVFQRPQHILTRFAQTQPVYFVEEPQWGEYSIPAIEVKKRDPAVVVLTPLMNHAERNGNKVGDTIKELLEQILKSELMNSSIFWFYTPMALTFANSWKSRLTVYDCMDELSAFAGADPAMVMYERQLLAKADVVFTGGFSLYEAKRSLHRHVYPVPSSIERRHFARAFDPGVEPADQAAITGQKIGFFGVIDERLDRDLIAEAAARKPQWQFILLGPVVKIDPGSLPQAPNIHFLGQKAYADLPDYLRYWDVAMLPFAMNDATRFISPTKTPEYLAGGRPVVSTPIKDVVTPYGEMGLVQIAYTPEDFAAKIEIAARQRLDVGWCSKVDEFLSQGSWDQTWRRMRKLMGDAFVRKGETLTDELGLANSGAEARLRD